MASGDQAQCLQFAKAVAAVELSVWSDRDTGCQYAGVCGGRASEAHRVPDSLFKTVFTLGCVWLHFLAGRGMLAATCIVQVALWSFGTDALQLCKLAARWKPRLVAQMPS